MRKISINKVEPGAVLAMPLYADRGATLVGAGMVLNDDIIKRIEEKGFKYVYIKDGFLDDVDFEEVITQATKQQVVDCIKRTTDSLKGNKTFRAGDLKKAMDQIMDDVLSKKNLLVALSDMRMYDEDDYLFNHSINVTVLSVVIGIFMYYPMDKLFSLGMGALLHDIGKTQIAQSIVTKNQPLNPQEYEEYKKHPMLGFQILRTDQEIKITSSNIALQHHERYDGSGYPRGLKGEGILEFARVVSIADAYDVMCNGRRGRKGMLPHQVCEEMTRFAGTHFDPNILDRFIQKIANYPTGTKIQLNNGKSGFVIKQNVSDHKRPMVRLFWNEDEAELSKPEEIDLTKELSLSIVKVLE